jgi:hypothetical protein
MKLVVFFPQLVLSYLTAFQNNPVSYYNCIVCVHFNVIMVCGTTECCTCYQSLLELFSLRSQSFTNFIF